MSWKHKAKESSRVFLDLVWPVIKHACGGGDIKPVEVLEDNDLARDLDVLCGIDVWHTIPGEGCRGIASRVQWGGRDFGTFTIRKRKLQTGAMTEYAKRQIAVQSMGRFIYPYLTCHAYVSADRRYLIRAALARTDKIMASVIPGETMVQRTHQGDAEFYCVPWNEVEGTRIFAGDTPQYELSMSGDHRPTWS